MSDAHATFKELLKSAGHSITGVRQAVFAALLDQEPMSMHDLIVKTKGADRASVYRSVELFETLGIVQRLNTGWKYKLELTDKFAAHHHHLTCTNCGKTIALSEDELERFIEHIARRHGFRPMSHQIELQGLCETCSLQNGYSR